MAKTPSSDAELPEIIMEINDLRRIPTHSRENAQKSQKGRDWVWLQPPPAIPSPATTDPYVKDQAHERQHNGMIPRFTGNANRKLDCFTPPPPFFGAPPKIELRPCSMAMIVPNA
jgi:hypothetical protein